MFHVHAHKSKFMNSRKKSLMLSDVSTADLLQDVHEELPDDPPEMLSSEDTSLPESIKMLIKKPD